MIKPEQIPDEVVEALLDTSNVAQPWKHAIAAALNAWPDVVDTHPNNIGHIVLQFKIEEGTTD